MSSALRFSALAVLVVSSAAASAGSPGDSGTQVTQPPGPCRAAVLRNGYTIQFARSEVAGPLTRLWLCGDSGAGYLETASDQIERFEDLPEPATPSRAVEATPSDAAPGPTAVKKPINELITGVAKKHQIDPDFVTSVVKAESGFDPGAVSRKGAVGLMQLMPKTAATLGVENVLDPAANLEGGTKYLRQLLDQYDGDVVKALAAYNAGPLRVEQYGGLPPYGETRAYVARIVNDYNRKKAAEKTQPPANSASQ